MDVAARRAAPVAGVKGLEKRRQVLHDVLDVHLDAVNARPAARAIPLESVVDVERPHLFHHQADRACGPLRRVAEDRKSTRLNSSHSQISYAVFCLKKKKKSKHHTPHL